MTFFQRAARFLGVSRRDSEIRRAIAELSTYTDRELADIGVSRGSIHEAVLHGRPGIDVPVAAAIANDDRHRQAVEGRAA